MKQRHNVQSIPFIFICHYVSALEIVLRGLFKVDRVLLSKIHNKIVAGRRGWVLFFKRHRGLAEW